MNISRGVKINTLSWGLSTDAGVVVVGVLLETGRDDLCREVSWLDEGDAGDGDRPGAERTVQPEGPRLQPRRNGALQLPHPPVCGRREVPDDWRWVWEPGTQYVEWEEFTNTVTWLYRTCSPCPKGDTNWEVLLCMFIFTTMLVA